MDPKLTISAPPKVTSAAGVDAFTHCLETYVARNATPLSEMYSLEGMKLIARSLRRVCDDGSDIEARTDMALGSYYGGVALAGAGAGAIHALAYPLGSRFHIPHGVSNSLMFSHVMKENHAAAPEKFAPHRPNTGRIHGRHSRSRSGRNFPLARSRNFVVTAGCLPDSAKWTSPHDAIPELAEAAFKLERLLSCNPKELSLEDNRENLSRRGLNMPMESSSSQELRPLMDITPGDMVCVMGAGGKATLMKRLIREMLDEPFPVIITSTTNLHALGGEDAPPVLLSEKGRTELQSAAHEWSRRGAVVWVEKKTASEHVSRPRGKSSGGAARFKVLNGVMVVKTDGARKTAHQGPGTG